MGSSTRSLPRRIQGFGSRSAQGITCHPRPAWHTRALDTKQISHPVESLKTIISTCWTSHVAGRVLDSLLGLTATTTPVSALRSWLCRTSRGCKYGLNQFPPSLSSKFNLFALPVVISRQQQLRPGSNGCQCLLL